MRFKRQVHRFSGKLMALCLALLLALGVLPVWPAALVRANGDRVMDVGLESQWSWDADLLEPEFAAVLPDGSGALITIQEGSAVAAVYNDGAAWQLAGIVQLPPDSEPDGIAVTAGGGTAITANEEGQSLSVIDLTYGLDDARIVDTVSVFDLVNTNELKNDEGEVDPEGITVFQRNGKGYAVVALEKAACLLVLDITDPAKINTVAVLPVGETGDEADPADRLAKPEGVAVSPDGDLIAVGNEEEGTVSLIPVRDEGPGISFGERVDFNPAGAECEIVSFTPDGGRLLVTKSADREVGVLDIGDLENVREIRTISLAVYGEPTSTAVHPGGEYALVAVVDEDSPTVNPGKVLAVSLLEPTLGQIFREFTVGQVPDSLAVTPDGAFAVVANEAENDDDVAGDDGIVGNVSVIDLAGVVPPPAAPATLKIAVFSDPHYFDTDLGTTGAAFEQYLAQERKLIAQSAAITRKVVETLKASDANIILVPGDLTKDGEQTSHQEFAALLAELERSGKQVYVINGNHDVNNANAVRYDGDATYPVDNVAPEEFIDIYRDFGYGEAIAADPDSLSYVVEPLPGLRIIAMDAAQYEPEAEVSGAFTASTLNWIKQQVSAARRQGKTVFGMMHHGLSDHFTVQRQLFPEYVVEDADRVAAELAARGMQVVFTGHFHAQDVVQKDFHGHSILDIETGSLVTYPCPYRLVELTPENELVITTETIDDIDDDLGGQDFPDYARGYLEMGLEAMVPEFVAGILIGQGVPAEDALARTNQLIEDELVPGLTVKDALVNSMLANYQGDESIDPELAPVYQAMAGSDDSLTQMIGGALLSMGNDPAPADNDLNIDLDNQEKVHWKHHHHGNQLHPCPPGRHRPPGLFKQTD